MVKSSVFINSEMRQILQMQPIHNFSIGTCTANKHSATPKSNGMNKGCSGWSNSKHQRQRRWKGSRFATLSAFRRRHRASLDLTSDFTACKS